MRYNMSGKPEPYIEPSHVKHIQIQTTELVLNAHGYSVVYGMIHRGHPHSNLKQAFDWENTPEGHGYWSRQYQRGVLSNEAKDKLNFALTMYVKRRGY